MGRGISYEKKCSMTVAKLLLRELLPRFGLPTSIETDRRTDFKNEIMELLCPTLQIDQNLAAECSYRPQSSGVVERMNGTIKNKLETICA